MVREQAGNARVRRPISPFTNHDDCFAGQYDCASVWSAVGTKSRRFAVAWDALRRIRPSRWITQRISIAAADEAYRLLDESPDETIQLVFTYS